MDYLPRPIPVLPAGGIAAEILFSDEFILAGDHKDDVSHLHDCCEVYVNLSGDVSFAIGSRVYPVTPGDVIITRPNELHHCIYHSDCRHGHYCLWMRPDEAYLPYFSCFFDRAPGEMNRISMDAAARDALIAAMERLATDGFGSAGGMSALFFVLDTLERHRFDVGASGRLPEDLLTIIRHIDEHFAGDCSAAALEREFFISRSTLCRRFRSCLGTSPARYVEARRMTAAREMLESGATVQDTVARCGFSDYSHFISAFRRQFGITPAKYAKNFK